MGGLASKQRWTEPEKSHWEIHLEPIQGNTSLSHREPAWPCPNSQREEVTNEVQHQFYSKDYRCLSVFRFQFWHKMMMLIRKMAVFSVNLFLHWMKAYQHSSICRDWNLSMQISLLSFPAPAFCFPFILLSIQCCLYWVVCSAL